MRKSVKIIMLFSVLLMVVGCGKQTTEKVLESAEAEQEEKYKQIAEEMGTLQWPTTGLATMLPVPESKKGKIDWMKSYGMFLYVGDTTEEQFNAYVDACYNQGFNMEMNRGEDYYMADNELGYSLDLRLWSYELMSIRVDQVQNTNDEASEPEETAPTEEAAPE